jgi:hypothetical protein
MQHGSLANQFSDVLSHSKSGHISRLFRVREWEQYGQTPLECGCDFSLTKSARACTKKQVSSRITRIKKFKMALLNYSDPCKSVLSVSSVVGFGVFVQKQIGFNNKLGALKSAHIILITKFDSLLL